MRRLLPALAVLLIGCGGPAPTPIEGTWRSWVAAPDALDVATTAGCGGATTLGTFTFEKIQGDEAAGRWDLCAGTANFRWTGTLLPDGWTLEVSTAAGLLTLLPRSASPARMTFELRGVGFSGQHMLVLERTNIRHGKIEAEQ